MPVRGARGDDRDARDVTLHGPRGTSGCTYDSACATSVARGPASVASPAAARVREKFSSVALKASSDGTTGGAPGPLHESKRPPVTLGGAAADTEPALAAADRNNLNLNPLCCELQPRFMAFAV